MAQMRGGGRFSVRSRPAVLWSAAAGLVLVAALVAVLVLRGDRPPAVGDYARLRTSDAGNDVKIRSLVTDFAAAVDRHDTAATVDLLCAREAGQVGADDDAAGSYDAAAGAAGSAPADPVVTLSDLDVAGDTAAATVRIGARPAVGLRFAREDGVWKICN